MCPQCPGAHTQCAYALPQLPGRRLWGREYEAESEHRRICANVCVMAGKELTVQSREIWVSDLASHLSAVWSVECSSPWLISFPSGFTLARLLPPMSLSQPSRWCPWCRSGSWVGGWGWRQGPPISNEARTTGGLGCAPSSSLSDLGQVPVSLGFCSSCLRKEGRPGHGKDPSVSEVLRHGERRQSFGRRVAQDRRSQAVPGCPFACLAFLLQNKWGGPTCVSGTE